ncbi:MAG TPA: hypothetical protein VIM77_01700 [Mucilaginibacter sp.]
MKPLFFTLTTKRHIMIIPDTHAHVDGHPVISYTYSLFVDRYAGNPRQAAPKESSLHLDKIKDPDYLGFIAFEKPGNVFSYTPGDYDALSVPEVEEVIEHIGFIRSNPQLWSLTDDI